jgi:hypothetical protein
MTNPGAILGVDDDPEKISDQAIFAQTAVGLLAPLRWLTLALRSFKNPRF